MKVSKMVPFGVKITDIDINSQDDLERLKPLLFENRIILLPKDASAQGTPSTFSPEGMTKIGKVFGKPLMNHEVDTFVEGTPVSEIVTGVPGAPPDADIFHSDLSWWKHPPSVGLLSCFIRPPGDVGHTIFQTSDVMYNSLSEESRQILHTNRFVHSLHNVYGRRGRTDVKNGQPDARTVHPGVIRHPLFGTPIPYISRSSVVAVEGMSKEDSAPIINRIVDEMTSNKNTYEHSWEIGDVIIWDNFGTQHMANCDYTERRVMRRVALMGDSPPPTKYEMPKKAEAKSIIPGLQGKVLA